MAVLKKESESVRLKIGKFVKRIREIHKVKPDDKKEKVEFEINDNERISIYRAIISILTQKEYDQIFMEWGEDICVMLKCEKEFYKKFKLESDEERPKGFKFDEEPKDVDKTEEKE